MTEPTAPAPAPAAPEQTRGLEHSKHKEAEKRPPARTPPVQFKRTGQEFAAVGQSAELLGEEGPSVVQMAEGGYEPAAAMAQSGEVTSGQTSNSGLEGSAEGSLTMGGLLPDPLMGGEEQSGATGVSIETLGESTESAGDRRGPQPSSDIARQEPVTSSATGLIATFCALTEEDFQQQRTTSDDGGAVRSAPVGEVVLSKLVFETSDARTEEALRGLLPAIEKVAEARTHLLALQRLTRIGALRQGHLKRTQDSVSEAGEYLAVVVGEKQWSDYPDLQLQKRKREDAFEGLAYLLRIFPPTALHTNVVMLGARLVLLIRQESKTLEDYVLFGVDTAALLLPKKEFIRKIPGFEQYDDDFMSVVAEPMAKGFAAGVQAAIRSYQVDQDVGRALMAFVAISKVTTAAGMIGGRLKGEGVDIIRARIGTLLNAIKDHTTKVMQGGGEGGIPAVEGD